MAEPYILIGHTKKTHGAQGELKVEIREQYLEDFAQADVVFLKIHGKPAPFFIENIRDAGDLLLKLEEVNSPTQAKEFTSKEIFLRVEDVSSIEEEAEDKFNFAEFTGFSLEGVEQGVIGKIIEVQQYPQQELALVGFQGREILIPLHPELVVQVNKKSKKLVMQLPEGLLDL